MSTILTIDQSTFSTKVFIIDTNGNIMDFESIPHQQIYPQSGWVEHNPNEIYDNLIIAVKHIKQRNDELIKSVAGISITNQRETTVVWDKTTQLPIYNAIVWQCRRTSHLCKKLNSNNELVEKLTGLKIDPYFSATKINWILKHCNQDIKQLMFGTMESWLIYKLTQGSQHVSDVTNASRTLLMNIHTLSWDHSLCNLFDIPMSILPTIKNNDDIFGQSDIEGLLYKKVPITGVIGDSQAALYAQHCFDLGMMKVTLGTGSSLLMNAGNKIPQIKRGIVGAVGWVCQKEVTYAKEAIINCSGDTLNWLKDQLHLFKDESELNKIWSKVIDNDGVYLVPAFVGLSVPWWEANAKASISGLQRNHTSEQILRAGLESIAYQIFDAAQALDYDVTKEIHVDGGAVANKGLIQFIADILGIKVIVSNQYDLSAMGSFEMANKRINGIDIQNNKQTIYTPQMSQCIKTKNIQGWHNAVYGVLNMVNKKDGKKYE